MDLIEELAEPGVSVVAACGALGVSRATLYRATTPAAPPAMRERASSPRKLSDEERQAIIDIMHSAEFVDQPPAEVFAKLLSRGVYRASIRTIYRVLGELGESKERRPQRLPQVHEKPSLTATAPNQVWTWDITKLPTFERGVFLHLYVILDLFSRYVVGWMVAAKECKHLATRLFAETVARHGVEPGLTVHSDRGSAMKSDTLAQLFGTLGISRSFSRPHVSDDNAFSEAQFRTLKYQPDYPERFSGVLHARGWLEPFLTWHNDDHQHAGLALFTPAEVFHGRVAAVHRVRQDALDAHYALHPERFPNGPPKAALPPAEVHINPFEVPVVCVQPAVQPAADRPRVDTTPGAAARADLQLAIPSSEPPQEASLCPSPALAPGDRAQAGSRAASPPSAAREPLTRPSTGAPSPTRRADQAPSPAIAS